MIRELPALNITIGKPLTAEFYANFKKLLDTCSLLP